MPASAPTIESVTAGDGMVGRLCGLIAEAQSADRLAPVTVITPTIYSSFFLRRAVMNAATQENWSGGKRRGLFNVEFTRIEEVADSLAADDKGAGQVEKRPLSSLIAGEFVSEAGKKLPEDGALGGLRDHPSFHRALHRTLNDLSAAGLSAHDLRKLSGHGRELADVAATYETLKGSRFEGRSDVAARAAALLPQSGLPRHLGKVIVLLAVVPASQYRVLYQALMRCPDTTTLVSLTGNSEADEVLANFAGTVARAAPADTDEKTGNPPCTVFISAPSPAAEARWVAANVLRLAREEGVLFSEMAVLYADRAYGTRLEEAFRFAGIPVSGPASSRPADWPEGRFLTGLLDALEPETNSEAPSLSRDAVTGWLTAAPVRDPATGGPAPSARWDGISRLAGVTGGLETWERGLKALRARLDRQARRAPLNDEQGGDMAGRAASLESDSAAALQNFMHALAEKGRIPVSGGWKGYVGWLRGLMADFQMPAPSGDDASMERRERIGLTLGSQEELGALGLGPPSFERFSQLLRDELARPAGKSGPLGSGVFLAHYRDGASASFKAVHIVGLAEGQVIAHDNPDPLLPDSDRARLNERGHGQAEGAAAPGHAALELREDRRAAQLLELEAAAQSGSMRFFSWPRSQAGAARETGPAGWLVQQARIAIGNKDLQPRDMMRPDTLLGDAFVWLEREERALAPGSIRAAGGADEGTRPRSHPTPEGAPDAHWRDVASVAAWARSGKYTAHVVVSDKDGPVAPALRLETSRYGEMWTEWDGNLTGDRQQQAAPQFPIASPTRYETWAVCPFSYFLEYELKVAPTERPEELLELTPAERGTLVHAVLEKFVQARMVALPATLVDEQILMGDVADRVFVRYEHDERIGHRSMWSIEKRSLRRSLRAWLSQDAEARSRSGAAPWRVELAFGKDGVPPVEVDLPDGVRLLFRGKIDRVDFSADGHVLVYDYKSGSPDKYGKLDEDVTKRGTLLQLPVYALAARRAVEQEGHTARSVSASYWPVLRTVTLALKPRPDDFDENKAVARLKKVAGVIASGVEKGVFPARPGAPRSGRDGVPGSPFENCEYCAFDRVCAAPGRRARLWERKRGSDLVLAPYVRLAEGDNTTEGREAEQ